MLAQDVLQGQRHARHALGHDQRTRAPGPEHHNQPPAHRDAGEVKNYMSENTFALIFRTALNETYKITPVVFSLNRPENTAGAIEATLLALPARARLAGVSKRGRLKKARRPVVGFPRACFRSRRARRAEITARRVIWAKFRYLTMFSPSAAKKIYSVV